MLTVSLLHRLDMLRGLLPHIDNPDLQREWGDVKHKNKVRGRYSLYYSTL